MSINLRPPSGEHWNIESDLILTLTMDTYQLQLEAKRRNKIQNGSLWELRHLQRDACSREGFSGCGWWQQGCVPNRDHTPGERDLETMAGIVECIHALRLQILHEMGGVRELEEATVRTLMAEFARLQSILCEDLTKSLSALRSELEASRRFCPLTYLAF